MTFEEAITELKTDKLCLMAIASHPSLVCVDEIDIAVQAIEKQIPKKPLDKKLANDGYCWQWICPNCHTIKITTENQFCADCGQALDWGDTE